MGYKSKVIIGVKSGKLSEEFDDILRKHNFPIDKPNGDYLKTIDDPNEMKRYQFEQIKWYDSYDCCKEIMEYLEAVQEVDDDKVFCLGLGEDGQIHSQIGHHYEYVEQISEINLID